MSSADLLEDGFPHGTPEGYAAGCRSGSCSAGAEYGLSCKTAKVKSSSDYQYQKLAKAGASVAAIADALGLVGTATPAPAASSAAPRPAPKAGPETVPAPKPARAPKPDPETTEPKKPKRSSKPNPRVKRNVAKKPDTKTLRAWAIEHGYDVGIRGTIKQYIQDAYAEWAAGDRTPTPDTPLTDAHEIRAFVGALRNEDGTLNASRVAQEATLREKAGLPAWIAELDVPRDTPEPVDQAASEETVRPEWGYVQLEGDLVEVTAQREEARDLAARLWDELERLERTRTAEQATHAAARKHDADRIDDDTESIQNLHTALVQAHRGNGHLRAELAAVKRTLATTEQALTFVLQKWGMVDAALTDTLGYLDQTIYANEDSWPDLHWTNTEVLELLHSLRARLMPGPKAGCPACSGSSRETVGLVCQTCGTDYSADTERQS